MIRLIFVALFVVLFLIIGIPVLGIEWLIGKVSKKTMDYSSRDRRGEYIGRTGSLYRKSQKLL